MKITPFDARFAPKNRENKPRMLEATGDAKKLQEAALENYRSLNPASVDLSFQALVLYVTPISVAKFKEKYDDVFEQFVLGPKAEKLGEKGSKNIKVLETIVYIPELCACLPTPKDSDGYFRLIKKLSIKPNQDIKEAAKSFRAEEKDKKQFSDLNQMVKQISRYPKAYYLGSSEGAGKTELTYNSMVKVKFIHNFDFSHGLVVSVDPK